MILHAPNGKPSLPSLLVATPPLIWYTTHNNLQKENIPVDSILKTCYILLESGQPVPFHDPDWQLFRVIFTLMKNNYDYDDAIKNVKRDFFKYLYCSYPAPMRSTTSSLLSLKSKQDNFPKLKHYSYMLCFIDDHDHHLYYPCWPGWAWATAMEDSLVFGPTLKYKYFIIMMMNMGTWMTIHYLLGPGPGAGSPSVVTTISSTTMPLTDKIKHQIEKFLFVN